MRTVDPGNRVALRRSIEADYGQHTIMPANQMPKIRRLPLRLLGVNYITGGGIPFSTMTRLWGAYRCGKTTLIYDAFYQAQHFGEIRFMRLNHLADLARVSGMSKDAKRLADQAKAEQERYKDGLKCLYICTEKRFDPSQPLAMGVDLSEDKLEVVMDTRIEEIGDIVQKALGAYHVIAVDSTSATISLDELGHKDGMLANLSIQRVKRWSLVMDWWRDRIGPENVLIFTSHIQSVIGMSTFQKMTAEHAPGGSKLNHEPSVILHLVPGRNLKYKKNSKGVIEADPGLVEFDEEGGEKGAFGKKQPAGRELVIKCEKNSTAMDSRICLLHHDKSLGTFDWVHDYVKLGSYFKVITQAGGWYTLPDGSKTQKIRQVVRENASLQRAIEDVVYRCAEDGVFERDLLAGRGGPGEAMVPELEGVA